MSTASGITKLVKAGFVQLDDVTGVVLRIIVFQYNPETLVRRLESVNPAIPLPPPAIPPSPRELVSFTLAFDAADKLELGDPLTAQNGILPAISALEFLLYPRKGELTLWVSGGKRIIPVRITELQITEQAFDAALNPIRAEVAVTLTVLKDADFANDPRGRALWDAHFAQLQQLATSIYNGGSLAALGLKGI